MSVFYICLGGMEESVHAGMQVQNVLFYHPGLGNSTCVCMWRFLYVLINFFGKGADMCYTVL